MSENTLFTGGTIVLLDTPLPGYYGIHRFRALLESGNLGVSYHGAEELWICALNRMGNRLRIFHVDEFGYSLTTRILYTGSFVMALKEASAGKITLTREQLRRLCIDGTLSGPYANPYVAKHEREAA